MYLNIKSNTEVSSSLYCDDKACYQGKGLGLGVKEGFNQDKKRTIKEYYTPAWNVIPGATSSDPVVTKIGADWQIKKADDTLLMTFGADGTSTFVGPVKVGTPTDASHAAQQSSITSLQSTISGLTAPSFDCATTTGVCASKNTNTYEMSGLNVGAGNFTVDKSNGAVAFSGTATIGSNVTLSPSASSSFTLPLSVGAPTANGHAATKSYVDGQVSGIVPSPFTCASGDCIGTSGYNFTFSGLSAGSGKFTVDKTTGAVTVPTATSDSNPATFKQLTDAINALKSSTIDCSSGSCIMPTISGTQADLQLKGGSNFLSANILDCSGSSCNIPAGKTLGVGS